MKKHGTNPVNGAPLEQSDLITLNLAKNDDGDMVDPVTYKVFTDNTHIVALKPSGNVFAYDTVQKLNVKAKMWRDLVSDQSFTRKDIITLQDPQNVESRNLSSFKYLKEGTSTLTPEQQKEKNDPNANLNKAALGSGVRALAKGDGTSTLSPHPANNTPSAKPIDPRPPTSRPNHPKGIHSTGLAAASLTSTGLTPHTSTAPIPLTTEQQLLSRPRLIRTPAFLLLHTTLGSLALELYPEFAPHAVYNFIQLSKRGYYNDTIFHRLIKNFMIQGGDPTGPGKGGTSAFEGGKPFKDEFDGPRKFDGRGVVGMANKGKGTNTSQFFILFREARHLDRKHTVFGKVIEEAGQEDVLGKMEKVEVGEGDRPKVDIRIETIEILIDPFEEYLKGQQQQQQQNSKATAQQGSARERQGAGDDDQTTTWTGKRLRPSFPNGNSSSFSTTSAAASVGKYLRQEPLKVGGITTNEQTEQNNYPLEEWEQEDVVGTGFGGSEQDGLPMSKKQKIDGKGTGGGFGNFDSW